MRANNNHSSTGRITPKGFDPQYGAGLVDAYRAILSLVPRQWGGPSPPPRANSLESFGFLSWKADRRRWRAGL